MKNKKFSLETILKIREYAEEKELQSLSNAMEEYNVLNEHIRRCKVQQNVLGESLLSEKHDFPSIKEVYGEIAAYEERKRKFMEEREKLKPNIDKAKKEYEKAYKEAESMRILKAAHKKDIHKQEVKKGIEEIQERMLWEG